MQQAAVKLLHIEDDNLYASLVQHMLTDDNGVSPYDITQVDSLKAALPQLNGKGFDIVLLDLGLDFLTGIGNVQAVCLENPDVPVIVLTGYAKEEMEAQALKAGARNFLVKGQAYPGALRDAIAASIASKAA